MEDKQTILQAMTIIADTTRRTTGDGLIRLFNAYNHLHVQLDGQRVQLPILPVPVFEYDPQVQAVRSA